jgi:hypothetical protein
MLKVRGLLPPKASHQEIQSVNPVSLADSVPPSASGGFLSRWVMKRMNKQWLAKGLSFEEGDYQELHQNFWKDREAKILSWALSAKQTTALVERCWMEDVSVNSTVYAAFLAAQDQVQDTSEDFYDTGVLVSNLGRLDIPTQFNGLELAWISPPQCMPETPKRL